MKKESKDKVLIDHFLHMLYLQGHELKYFSSFTDQCCIRIPSYKKNFKKGDAERKVWLLVSRVLPLQTEKLPLSLSGSWKI